MRLVRGELGNKAFRRENRTFRDAGRPLSALRDAKVLVDSLDGLIQHFEQRVKGDSFAHFRRVLLERQRATRKQVIQRDRAVLGITRRIGKAKKRVNDWPLRKRGWKAIEAGLQSTYAQARSAMSEVRDKSSDETLHEWRKRTKDLRYELELLQCIWPETIEPLVEQSHRLTDLLGDDHDLAVLREVAQETFDKAHSTEKELLMALVNERRERFRKRRLRWEEKFTRRPMTNSFGA